MGSTNLFHKAELGITSLSRPPAQKPAFFLLKVLSNI